MKCANCGKNHSGGLCPWCGHVEEAPKPSEAQIASAWRKSEQRHGVPALLSFFVPGLGQLIKGNIGTAFTVWAGLGIFIGVGLAGLWLTFLGIPILWCWSLYDAYVAPDGPARRELDRIAKTMVVLIACGLAGAGCGSVTAKGTDDDAGTGGAGGKVGVESGSGGQGGEASSDGGPAQRTGGSGGATPGTGGHATGGAGGISAGTGGAQATGGIAGTGGASCPLGDTLCPDGACASGHSQTNCGTCGNVCAGGASCFNGTCTCGSISQAFCSGLCVDITTTSNCGGCGRPCASGQSCSNGRCV